MKFKILPILGDASYRKFYRLKTKKSSKIIVLAKKNKYTNLIAYSSINKFLRKKKILAPRTYSHNFSKGLILIEDFGNKSFYKILSKRKNKLIIYKKIVNLLLKIQKIYPSKKIKNINGGSHVLNKYSKKYLFRESDLFFDWYLPLYLNKKKVKKIKKKANKILFKIYSRINYPNSYFVHRDYHAQNLMKVGEKIGVIDSQDALIGNPAYDLVSLIDDVRLRTSKKLKNQIYNYYLQQSLKIRRINKKYFLEDFNILSVQRSLKIIGIFTRLFIRDKKTQYLKYIPYTWQLLEMRMESKIFSELKKILNSNISKAIKKKSIYQ